MALQSSEPQLCPLRGWQNEFLGNQKRDAFIQAFYQQYVRNSRGARMKEIFLLIPQPYNTRTLEGGMKHCLTPRESQWWGGRILLALLTQPNFAVFMSLFALLDKN